jgi:hypothetical protein
VTSNYDVVLLLQRIYEHLARPAREIPLMFDLDGKPVRNQTEREAAYAALDAASKQIQDDRAAFRTATYTHTQIFRTSCLLQDGQFWNPNEGMLL